MHSGKRALFYSAAVALCLCETGQGLLVQKAEAQGAIYGPAPQHTHNGYLIDDALTLLDDDFLTLMEQEMRQRPDAVGEIADRAKELRPHLETSIHEIAAEVAWAGGTTPATTTALVVGGLAAAAGVGVVAIASGSSGSDNKNGDQDTPGEPDGPPEPTPDQPAHFETPEYHASNGGYGGHAVVQASSAYARGYTGEGVIVAIMDSGLDVSHPEFAGKVVAPYNVFTGLADVTDLSGHGTHVAGIIGANRDEQGMHGLAYGARLMPVSVLDENGRGPSAGLAIGWNYAKDNGATVVNSSLSFDSNFLSVFDSREYIEQAIPDVVEAAQELKEAGVISVLATGNASLDQSDLPAALPHHFPELQGFWVAVGSVEQVGDQIVRADYSNACGVAAEWCLVAPGSEIYSTVPGTVPGEAAYDAFSGTSMATPYVSAAVAILKQAFPYLEAPETLEILFETATDLGDPALFGHGLLNLERATRPLGQVAVPTSSSIGGGRISLDATVLHASPAFGDGIALALQDQTVLGLDAYNRGFDFDMDQLTTHKPRETARDALHRLKLFGGVEERSLRRIEQGPFSITSATRLKASDPGLGTSPYSRLSFGFSSGRSEIEFSLNPHVGRSFGLREEGFAGAPMVEGDAFDQPHLSLMQSGYGSTVSFAVGEESVFRLGVFTGDVHNDRSSVYEAPPNVTGAIGEFRTSLTDSGTLSLALGALSEEGSLLGTVSKGAFGEKTRSETLFTNLGASFDITRTARLTFSGSLGQTAFTQNGMVEGGSGIITSSFGIGLSQRELLAEDDAFSIAVSQPLRVESGRVDLNVPSSRNMDGSIGYRRLRLNPQPSGREINFQATYGFTPFEGAWASVGAMHRIQPGHVAENSADTIGLATLSFSF